VDGELSKQTALNSEPLQCEAPFMIGAQPPGGGGPVTGIMDEVCLFNVGLTEDDVRGIYNDGIEQYILAVEAQGKLATTWAALRIR